jgi:uncharacterized protein YkwD
MRYWVIALVISVVATDCGGVIGGSAATTPMKTYSISALESRSYETDVKARATKTPARDQILSDLIETHTEGEGRRLIGDGRLDELAAWVLDNLTADDRPPPFDALDFATHHLGIPEPTPHLLVIGLPDADSVAHELEKKIPEIMTRYDYTHYGIATNKRAGALFLAVAFSARWFRIAPVPRRIEANASVRLKGTLTEKYRNPIMAVTKPDNTSVQEKGKGGPEFDLSIVADQTGTYRTELLAQGSLGPTVLANFPIYVGVDVPRQITIVDDSGQGPSLDSRSFIDDLFRLINQTREQYGLEPLDRHAQLNEVAEAHCIDMDRNGFVGHQSPQTGKTVDRVKRAGIESSIVLENIGRGYSAQEVHSGLMQSPAHRANVLSRDVTHVGLGVVIQADSGKSAFLATELFIRVVDNIDIESAPDRVLDMINDVRESRGLEQVDDDGKLAEYAQQAAFTYFEQPNLSDKALARRIHKRLGKTASRFRQVATLLKQADSLEQIKDVEQLLDPGVQTVGIGVAQGSRKGEMPNTILIVVIMAWHR